MQSVVVTSGKPSFLAGADLVMVRGYTDQAKTATHEQMFQNCGPPGTPVRAAGEQRQALGRRRQRAGARRRVELELACRQRVVADDPKLQLGVPEVRWGLLPGAGGTQRLPRLAPFGDAMKMLLSGSRSRPRTVALG